MAAFLLCLRWGGQHSWHETLRASRPTKRTGTTAGGAPALQIRRQHGDRAPWSQGKGFGRTARPAVASYQNLREVVAWGTRPTMTGGRRKHAILRNEPDWKLANRVVTCSKALSCADGPGNLNPVRLVKPNLFAAKTTSRRLVRLGLGNGRDAVLRRIVKTAVIQLEGHLTDIPGNAQRQGGLEVGIDNRRRRVSIGGGETEQPTR